MPTNICNKSFSLRILPITLSFLVQSRKILYRDAQEMIIYQIGYFLGALGAYLNLAPGDAHLRSRAAQKA